MIEQVITILSKATELPIKPHFTGEIENCIIYTTSCGDDGAVARHRLELRLITSTYAEAEEYKKTILSTLITTGDDSLTDDILSCTLNGGGSLYDGGTKTYHTLMYFDVITRSVKYEQ